MKIQQIISIIDDQIKLINDLSILAKQKEQAIIKNEIDKVELINKQELSVIEKLNGCAQAKSNAINDYLESVGILNNDNSIELLVDNISIDEKKILDKKENEFKASVRLQVERNKLNNRLIKLQLSQIDIMLSSLSAPVSNNYSGQGQVDSGDGQKRTVFEFSV